MPISDNVRLLREHFNITQKELATIAGVSESAVSLWELEKTQPRMGAIQKMADHFGIKKSNIIEEGGMAEILTRPYNLNDLDHFENIPHDRLNRVQRESLEGGVNFSKAIFKQLDALTNLIVEALDELPEEEKQRVLDYIEFQRQQRKKSGSGEEDK